MGERQTAKGKNPLGKDGKSKQKTDWKQAKIEYLQSQVSQLQAKLYGKGAQTGWRNPKKRSRNVGKMQEKTSIQQFAPRNPFEALREEDPRQVKINNGSAEEPGGTDSKRT